MTSPDVEPRTWLQEAHLTCPATQWRYVESAVTRSDADLVMLDLEDSIPREDPVALALGRANVLRALSELEWGRKLRFFRPRGLALDPEMSDLAAIVPRSGGRLHGVTIPKVEAAHELFRVDERLTELERTAGLSVGSIRLHALLESVRGEEEAFLIARASPRLAALVFGAFDYWASLGITGVPYRRDHPLVEQARWRVVKAAASVGIPAIAEMTVELPSREKSEEERAAALQLCEDDARRARELGFEGKWVAMPAQVAPVKRAFALAPSVIERALREVTLFAQAEREGKGALVIDGKMADRATDRIQRGVLLRAFAQGRLDGATIEKLGLLS